MKNFYYQFILSGLLLMSLQCSAQDLHFSQFYETAILRNPALTGVFTGDYKVGVMYRNQWSSISNPYQTGLVSAEARNNVGNANDFVSYGMVAYFDRAGSIDLQTLAVYPAISYNKSINDNHSSFISVGFTGAYMQNSFAANKATFNNQYQNNSYNPANATGETLPTPHIYNWDMGAGVAFNTSAGSNNEFTYIIGASGYHFSTPQNSFYKNAAITLQMRWNVNGGLSWQINETYSLLLQANYLQQGQYKEIMAGGLLSWTQREQGSEAVAFGLAGGFFYRYDDAIVPVVKIKYKDYSFGVSYDVNISTLKAASVMRGGYEISVFKTGIFSNASQDRGKTICPTNFF
ncbi:MAG: PorP/SprF family type IX secretion system membrane protein [Taibaiella sp.]|nr:PorP/SprF family type IX secretion system membrane protein [Taibaiella sp.]